MGYKVFINYRKSLSAKDAKLLQNILLREFGRGSVFLDSSELEGGDHWPSTLEKQVDASRSMVALIPAGWADVLNEKGERRLDNPNDFVRFEIARAFTRNIPVLPVLVDGASVPAPANMPTNLIALTALQAMPLRLESFDDDAQKIAKRLKHLIAAARPRGVPGWAAGGMAVVALAAGVAFWPAAWKTAALSPPWVDSMDPDTSARIQQLIAARESAFAKLKNTEVEERKLRQYLSIAAEQGKKQLEELERSNKALEEQSKKLIASEERIAALSVQVNAEMKASRDAQGAAKICTESLNRLNIENSYAKKDLELKQCQIDIMKEEGTKKWDIIQRAIRMRQRNLLEDEFGPQPFWKLGGLATLEDQCELRDALKKSRQ